MDACIEWSRGRTKAGYGQIRDKKKKKDVYIHRVTWEKTNGPIPEGMHIAHLCHNPPCYNLKHLYLATPAENEQDKVRSGRHHLAKKTHCLRGHEFTKENTQYTKQTKGNYTSRQCKTCKKIYNREAYRKKHNVPIERYRI